MSFRGRLRHSLWRRLGVVVIALGLAGAGTGIAAAAGVFGPTTPPKITFGSARGLMNPADNYNAPGEVTRFVGQGPDGATFTVVSASSHPNSGCIKLVLTAPPTTQDRSIPGGCEARGNMSVPAPTTSRPSTSDYGMDNVPWKGPGGEMYTIWYGQGPPGTVSIHLVRTVGHGPVPRYKTLGATVAAAGRWFAVAIPKGDSIALYNPTGKVLDRGATGVHPGGPRMCSSKQTAKALVPC